MCNQAWLELRETRKQLLIHVMKTAEWVWGLLHWKTGLCESGKNTDRRKNCGTAKVRRYVSCLEADRDILWWEVWASGAWVGGGVGGGGLVLGGGQLLSEIPKSASLIKICAVKLESDLFYQPFFLFKICRFFYFFAGFFLPFLHS